MILNKKHMIAAAMLVCFSVAYLPVTGTWYLSMNGRSDLTRLIVSAIMVKKHVFQVSSPKDLDRSMQSIFKELKIATGQLKRHETHKKSAVSLTEIVPDFPVPGMRLMFSAYPDFFVLMFNKKNVYKIDPFPPDLPPPEHVFVPSTFV